MDKQTIWKYLVYIVAFGLVITIWLYGLKSIPNAPAPTLPNTPTWNSFIQLLNYNMQPAIYWSIRIFEMAGIMIVAVIIAESKEAVKEIKELLAFRRRLKPTVSSKVS